MLLKGVGAAERDEQRVYDCPLYGLGFGGAPRQPPDVFREVEGVVLQSVVLVQRQNIEVIANVVRMLLALHVSQIMGRQHGGHFACSESVCLLTQAPNYACGQGPCGEMQDDTEPGANCTTGNSKNRQGLLSLAAPGRRCRWSRCEPGRLRFLPLRRIVQAS